jgi:hypothetical protein
MLGALQNGRDVGLAWLEMALTAMASNGGQFAGADGRDVDHRCERRRG